MDEEQAKVHNHHHKSKHRRGTSRRNVADSTTPPPPITNPTTNPIVIVQSHRNDDDTVDSPASSSNIPTNACENDNIDNTSVKETHSAASVQRHDDNTASVGGSPNNVQTNGGTDEKVGAQKGMLGYLERTRKNPQSLSDPTTSPAQRSIRSRCSNEKSPRQKRSKSESRRRRERKLIAAGEMEVRQANETLMRYLKQCSEINDASLSGELEIDKSIDDRCFHRKTKSQRERERQNGLRSSNSSIAGTANAASLPDDGKAAKSKSANGSFSRAVSYARERIPPSGLSSILQELTSDIIPNHDDIYNPFTPVVSPTEGARTDKMFIQTPRGFRPVSDSTFLKTLMNDDPESSRLSTTNDAASMSCIVQRIWILFANICHGLLAGLALAHILFILTTTPKDLLNSSLKQYLSSAEIYTNTFYCLAILCLVSILDRMDICRWSVLNSNESISFRWIIIVMIYVSTIILCLSSESFDERFYLVAKNINTNGSVTAIEEMGSSRVLNIWSSLSLARSIGAIIGWILIGLRPTEDNLYDQLLEMEKYKLANN